VFILTFLAMLKTSKFHSTLLFVYSYHSFIWYSFWW